VADFPLRGAGGATAGLVVTTVRGAHRQTGRRSTQRLVLAANPVVIAVQAELVGSDHADRTVDVSTIEVASIGWHTWCVAGMAVALAAALQANAEATAELAKQQAELAQTIKANQERMDYLVNKQGGQMVAAVTTLVSSGQGRVATLNRQTLAAPGRVASL
jgi:hypothetical protein